MLKFRGILNFKVEVIRRLFTFSFEQATSEILFINIKKMFYNYVRQILLPNALPEQLSLKKNKLDL